jgi:2-keto-myo-inositol isomerase
MLVGMTLSRRQLIQWTPCAFSAAAAASGAATGHQMTLSMHQYTSAGAGYRRSLEGWAKAGVRHVEPASNALDEFLRDAGTMASAKRILTDHGLTIVSGAVGATGLWEPNPDFAANLDQFKRRCEQFAELGAPLVYSPCVTAAKFTTADYSRSLDQIRRAADVAGQFRVKVAAEFVRNSTFMASLPTALRLKREAAHPNFGVLFDCYHFWSGPSKFEDLDLIQPGEIIHAHINDTQDLPREMLDSQSRVIPGDGVAPLARILRKLVEKGYKGPISVELFLPKYQQADPFTLAREIKQKCEALFRVAGV